MSELKFQKELVMSAKSLKWVADITTHKFKKGWPDVMWKGLENLGVFTECKYVDLRPNGQYIVHVETTELQKHCLRSMQDSGMPAVVLVKVTVDKKSPRCYVIKDIDLDKFEYKNTNLPFFEPIGKIKLAKGSITEWPMKEITQLVQQLLPQTSQ